LRRDSAPCFWFPTGLALVALALVAFTRLRLLRGALETAAAVALFGASSLWLLFALGAETGAGVELGALAGFGVGLASSALAPLLAVPGTERGLRRVLLAGAGLVMLAAAALALGVAPYSEERPQRLNLIYVTDGESGAAHWLVEQTTLSGSAGMAVPGALRQAAAFGDEPAAVLPWSERQFPAAPAPPANMPPPEVQLVSSEETGGEQVLQLELRSPRGASRLALYIPEAYGLSRITIAGAGTSSNRMLPGTATIPSAASAAPVTGCSWRCTCSSAARPLCSWWTLRRGCRRAARPSSRRGPRRRRRATTATSP
jgi:hypothetical protein